MCKGFGLIIDKELNAYFCEPGLMETNCSHTDILERLGWKENNDPYLRSFIRVQFPSWNPAWFEFDEEKTLPGWARGYHHEIKDKCTRILKACVPAWTEYKKVHDTEFEKYRTTLSPIWKEYDKAEFAVPKNKKIRDAAWEEYRSMRNMARAEYQLICVPAWLELIQAFTKVPGYVIKVNP